MGRGIVAGGRVLIDGTARPRPGQVWAYVDPSGRVLVHRVRSWKRGSLVLQGDGNPLPDPPVDPACLVGRVRLVERGDALYRPDGWRAIAPVARQWWGAVVRRTAGRGPRKGP